MDKSKYFHNLWRAILISVVSLGLCAGIASAATNDKEPDMQKGSFLIKFKRDTNIIQINEVAKYYGASKTLSLSKSELSSRKNPAQWKKLEFESVKDVKDIARRIIHDNRVDEVDKVYFKKIRH